MARWLSRAVRPRMRAAHREKVAFLGSLLPRGALCFDVGANVGEYSEALLKAGMKVVAFEPNPEVTPELKARCLGHPHWQLIEAAAGSGASIATLYAGDEHAQASLQAAPRAAACRTYHVPVVTLDAAIAAFGRPDFCKIDVEGWELEVLEGLSTRIPLISFEFHLNDENILRTICCLRRLAGLGAAKVNIGPPEAARFLWSDWKPLEAFLEWFPGDLRETLPGDTYGDIYVQYESKSDSHSDGPSP